MVSVEVLQVGPNVITTCYYYVEVLEVGPSLYVFTMLLLLLILILLLFI
jgi:hypothetical protein